MRVLFVSAEFYPLAKTGGLADVSAALPAALRELGIDVRVLLPGYPQALEQAPSPRVILQLGNPLGCEAPDAELLFVEWLNAIIYEMATRNMVFGRFEVRLSDGRLQGKLWGEAVDRVRHEPACEPKGATYTALQVSQDTIGTWTARCVVDV